MKIKRNEQPEDDLDILESFFVGCILGGLIGLTVTIIAVVII